MPIVFQGGDSVFSETDAVRLWQETIVYTGHADDEVTVRFVNERESRRLNFEYRKKDKPTNVLTFNYDNAHDVAFCVPVVEAEAQERGVAVRDYTALVLTHAFLHATGLDHEASADESARMRAAEQAILKAAGFHATLWG